MIAFKLLVIVAPSPMNVVDEIACQKQLCKTRLDWL